jgi:predicted aspartyl protease/tetratricopeptide (TPR) repeat protein
VKSGRKWVIAAIAMFAVQSGVARANCQFGLLAELPVTMRGMRASVPVSVDGHKTDLWLDSGAFFNFMSRAKASEFALPLKALPDGFYISGIGGAAQAELATVKNLNLAGIPFPKMDFVVGGSDSGNGMLGANLFFPFDTEFDMAHGQVKLFRAKGCAKTNLGYWAGERYLGVAKLVQNDDLGDHHIYAEATVNGSKIRVMFDTGAPGSTLTRKAAQRAGIDMTKPDVVESDTVHGVGMKGRRSWTVRSVSFEIGGEAIRNTPLEVIDEDFANFDMIAGMDFFLSHHILVSRSQNLVYLTYNGGRIFSTGNDSGSAKQAVLEQNMGGAAKISEPTDHTGFARRGSARLARDDYPGAIADLTKAIELAPTNGEYLRFRARAYAESGQMELARKDHDAAIRLMPNDPKLLISQAFQALDTDNDAARAMTDQAVKLTPKGSLDGIPLIVLFERLGQADRALILLNDMVALHRQDHALGGLLNARCWNRGLANVEINLAMKDCETAIRRDGALTRYVDSRALIRLRQKDYKGAIADYDTVLAAGSSASASYLRGVAKLAMGQKDAGNADIAVARLADAKTVDRLVAYGLVAP